MIAPDGLDTLTDALEEEAVEAAALLRSLTPLEARGVIVEPDA